ncbi:MAG: 4Fe-4S dicluster domain-containing protein [Armatimonadota bacterium]
MPEHEKTGYEKKLLKEIYETVEGAQIKKCIQCGTCAGSCPVVEWMDNSPRKIFELIKEGLALEALSSNTPWVCASCYLCTVRCPKNIKITDVMYAVKRLAIKEKAVPRGVKSHILAQTFDRLVHKYGRNAEMEMLVTYFLKTNPFNLIGMAPVGMGLFFNRRLGILPHTIKGKKQIDAIVDKVKSLRNKK